MGSILYEFRREIIMAGCNSIVPMSNAYVSPTLGLPIVDQVDDVIEEPGQNQLRIGIADTDGEPRWL